MTETEPRPFGMRYLVAATSAPLREPAERPEYDPIQQINVTSAGDPWALVADHQRGESTTEVTSDGTRTDHTDPY